MRKSDPELGPAAHRSLEQSTQLLPLECDGGAFRVVLVVGVGRLGGGLQLRQVGVQPGDPALGVGELCQQPAALLAQGSTVWPIGPGLVAISQR